MKITAIKYYGGARDKVCRLALADLFLEVQEMILNTEVCLLEERQSNGGAYVREEIDKQFTASKDWVKKSSGGIDWIKRLRYNQTLAVSMGVEIQVSARSDMLIRDIVHLRNSLQEGTIDIGAIVVPNDRMQQYLPDRTPSLKDAVRYIEQEFQEAKLLPLIVIAIEHDAPGKALLKKRTNTARLSSDQQ